jgi:hypothetical protein
VTYIEELRLVVKRLHGVESKHIESVPIKEIHNGQTVWDGVVEVFELIGHPAATRLYAWAHNTDDPKHPCRYVTVLHCHPIQSARDAVRAAIVQEFRDNAPTEA